MDTIVFHVLAAVVFGVCISDRVSNNSYQKSAEKYTFFRVHVAVEKWVNETTSG